MEVFIQKFNDFFEGERISSLANKAYEWFELTLITLFGKIPYEPIRDLFTNPWFWLIIFFIILLFLIFRRR